MKRTQSLKFKQILVIALTVFLASSFISIVGRISASRRLEEEVRLTLQAYSEQLAISYSTWLEMETAQLLTFAEHIKVDYADPEFYNILAGEAKRLGFNSMSPTDGKGILHLAGGRTVDLSGRAYLQELFRTGKPVISDPVFSAVEGEEDLLTILVAVPIIREGKLAGALVGQKMADFLSENLSSIDYDRDSVKYVLNTQGDTIANTDYQMVIDKVNPLTMASEDSNLADLGEITRRMVSGEKGSGEYTFQGQRKIVAFAPIRGTGWSAAISAPYDTVFESLEAMTRLFTIITVVAELAGIALAVFLGGALTKPLIYLNGAMEEIAQGEADLTRRLQLNRKDELEELARSFNRFLEKLQGIITALRNSQGSLEAVGSELSATSQETASAINQIMANIEGVRKQAEILARNTGEAAQSTLKVTSEIASLDNIIDEQVNSSSEASSVIEEMIANIQEVGGTIARMAGSAGDLMTSVGENRRKQEAMDQRVREISSQSELLLEANEIISGIASQTNLLAMNAAIEAAHAGEAGRGFSVVADEIRKLAENSAEQSHKIGNELSRIQVTIGEVVQDTQNSRAAFAQLSSDIEEVEGLVRQVDQAMQEQSEGSRQVLDAIGAMNRIGHSVKEKATDMKRITEQAALAMDSLTESSLTIQGSMDEMASGAEQINQAASSVSALAGATSDSIKEMDDQIGKFTV